MMQGTDVQLPKTLAKPIQSKEERLVITLNKNRDLYQRILVSRGTQEN
jgi:hypothetical protein